MIYDTPITICKLPDNTGSLPQADALKPLLFAYAAELEVYHRRFWAAVQAGARIDCMVEIPLHRPEAEAEHYADWKGHTYRIVQSQMSYNDHHLPVTRISLERMERNYDIARV